jgi:hypothetical protein
VVLEWHNDSELLACVTSSTMGLGSVGYLVYALYVIFG